MNRFKSFFFWGAYQVLLLTFTIKANFPSPEEQIIGTIICMVIPTLIDGILYTFAYKATGIVTTDYEGKEQRSAIHWKIRVILMVIVILIGLTGLYQYFLIQITHKIYIIMINLYNSWVKLYLRPIFRESL